MKLILNGCWIRAFRSMNGGLSMAAPTRLTQCLYTWSNQRKYLEHLNSPKFHHGACFYCLFLCRHEPSSPANAIVRSYWLFVHYNPGIKWSWFSNHYFMMWLLNCSNITCQQSTAATHSLRTAVNILLCHAVQYLIRQL